MANAGGGVVRMRFVVSTEELKELGVNPATLLGQSSGGPGLNPRSGQEGPQGAPLPTEVPGQGSKGGGGGGMLGGAASAAIVGALTGGVATLITFFGQLLQNSQVLNTYAQGFGKVFSAAIDILLIPFLPLLNLMLAGVTRLLAWLIDSGYLENMSKVVQTQIMPLLATIGTELSKIWDDMSHSLNPMNWDWASLGKTAAAMLEMNASMLLGLIETALNQIPGVNISTDFAKGMAENAMSLAGNPQQLSDQDFKTMMSDYLLSVAGGAAVGQVAGVVPGVGATTGAAAGAAFSSLGLLQYKPSAGGGSVPIPGAPMLDMYGQTPTTLSGQPNPQYGRYNPANTTINATINIHSQEDADKEMQKLKASFQQQKSSVAQIKTQPGG